MTNLELKLDIEMIIFNTMHKDIRHLSNFIVLIAKSFMYTKCCLGEKLNIPEFESLINSCEYYDLENRQTERQRAKAL